MDTAADCLSGSCGRQRRRRFFFTTARAAFVIFCFSLAAIFFSQPPDRVYSDGNYAAVHFRRLLSFEAENESLINKAANQSDDSDPLFPSDLFTFEELKKGAVALHIIGIVYMFYALALVCDEFFVPSLDVITEKLGISPDVAGATFMAAGGSAPELFTSVIGVFIAKSDVGIGTIVGSAVFNILFVIAACAFAAKEALSLTAWPMIRDVFFYAVSLIILVVFFLDNRIEWWEALILLFWYAAYVGFMRFNEIVEDKLRELLGLPPSNREVRGITLRQAQYRKGLFHLMNETINPGLLKKKHSFNPPADVTEMRPLTKDSKEIVIGDQVTGIAGLKTQLQVSGTASTTANVSVAENGSGPGEEMEIIKAGDSEPNERSTALNGDMNDKADHDGVADDDNQEDPIDMSFPSHGGWKKILVYIVSFPIMAPLYVTLCDTKKKTMKKYYAITFIGSIIWIAIYSYLMVWWATVAGNVIGIPPEVMGLTFLAAGTSVPDLITSVLVAKQGKGDMAVSSSVGSNIFDVTVGLPLPWLLYTIVNLDAVQVSSYGVGCSVSLLFVMLVFVFLSVLIFKWKMTKGMGVFMLILYILFVIVTLGFNYDWYTCPI